MEIILDIETTTYTEGHEEGKSLLKGDPRPYSGKTKLVMVGAKVVDFDIITFDADDDEGRLLLQTWLDKATLVIGHNLKFDLSWLYECGYKYDGAIWDTMNFEYLRFLGTKESMSLDSAYLRYFNRTAKMSTLHDYLEKGINVDKINRSELETYLLQDLKITEEVYKKQREILNASVISNKTAV